MQSILLQIDKDNQLSIQYCSIDEVIAAIEAFIAQPGHCQETSHFKVCYEAKDLNSPRRLVHFPADMRYRCTQLEVLGAMILEHSQVTGIKRTTQAPPYHYVSFNPLMVKSKPTLGDSGPLSTPSCMRYVAEGYLYSIKH